MTDYRVTVLYDISNWRKITWMILYICGFSQRFGFSNGSILYPQAILFDALNLFLVAILQAKELELFHFILLWFEYYSRAI